MSLEILETLRKYNITLEQTGTRYRACCPLPGHSDNTPSFVVYPETNSYYCFGCSRGGGPIQFIMQFEGISKEKVMERLQSGDLAVDIARILEPRAPVEETFNTELNFIISSMIRKALLEGKQWSQVSTFLKDIDRKLSLEKLSEQQAKEVIDKVHNFLNG